MAGLPVSHRGIWDPGLCASVLSSDDDTGGLCRRWWRRSRRKIYLFPKLQVIERLRSYRWTGLQSFVRERTAFSRTIAGEKTPLALGRDSLKSVDITHAVYQTSQNGMAVMLGD